MKSQMYNLNGIECSLAIATPKRIHGFLQLYGKKELSELFLPAKENVEQSAGEFNKLALNAVGDGDKAAELLSICLDRPFTKEQAEDIPVDQIAQVNMDFFFTLIMIFYAQVK